MVIAQGSLEETRYYFVLAGDLGYIRSAALLDRAAEVGRLLNALIKSIEKASSSACGYLLPAAGY